MERPDFYAHHPDEVTLIQTHISFVFLAGDQVYKVKKPVRFTFLDFSTLEQRRHFCREEVHLNRRLAPGVYYGVVAICAGKSGYRLGTEEDPEAVEYAVHMRRLPDDRFLSSLLEQGAVDTAMIDAVAARLVAFHREAGSGEEVRANGDPAAVAAVLDDNYRGVAPFRGVTIPAQDDDAIQAFSRDFLARNAQLFHRRQAEGRIRDGHGDLHTEHICLTDPLVIFDCIEFSPKFRYCDVASEIAFLAMDLDYRGHPALASRIVATYAKLADDPELISLVPFYQCYRAYVRGKVDSLKSAELEVDPRERSAAREGARRHFALSYRYTWRYSPCLVVFAGLSGSGKSTLAASLAERTGFTHVNSDVVRKRLLGLPPTARQSGTVTPLLYTPEHSARTYAAMLADAEGCLTDRRGVIIDATFQLRAGRDRCREIARVAGKPLVFIECRCEPAAVRRRLTERARRNDDPSDADWEVYLEQRRRYEPLAPDEDRLTVQTDTTSPEEALRAVETEMRRRCSS